MKTQMLIDRLGTYLGNDLKWRQINLDFQRIRPFQNDSHSMFSNINSKQSQWSQYSNCLHSSRTHGLFHALLNRSLMKYQMRSAGGLVLFLVRRTAFPQTTINTWVTWVAIQTLIWNLKGLKQKIHMAARFSSRYINSLVFDVR